MRQLSDYSAVAVVPIIDEQPRTARRAERFLSPVALSQLNASEVEWLCLVGWDVGH